MLGKLLLTIAVIVTAFFVIRQRNMSETANTRSSAANRRAPKGAKPAPDSLAGDLRLAAYMFLVLMVGLGATMYYFRWQDDHTVLTVNLHRDNQVAPVSYEVYKFQLQNRSFVTLDGTSVTVASSERMEVLGLEP
jgi:ABC-type Fe3+ transport system permease subunit